MDALDALIAAGIVKIVPVGFEEKPEAEEGEGER
jgi:hypothetical protein